MDQRGFDAQQQPHRSGQIVARRHNRCAGRLLVGMPIGGLAGRAVVDRDHRLINPRHSLSYQPHQPGILKPGRLQTDLPEFAHR